MWRMAAPRPLRADAERNRRRILDAARDVFARRGLEAGVDEVARVAGVGVGTLYRRFPTKDELLLAVVEDLTATVAEEIEASAADDDPGEAFAAAARALAASTARNRALHQVFQESWPLIPAASECRDRILGALAPILERAQAAGAVRDDLVVADIPSLCAVAARLPSWRLESEPELWTRYLAVILDGSRPEAARRLPHPPPREVSPSPAAPSASPATSSPRVRARRP
jgi:AcrR family transcriptional regulator